jgi:sporulation-control protein spo0M
MITLTITLPDGSSATIGNAETWTSQNSILADMLNRRNELEGAADYLPHPFLDVAKRAAEELGGELRVEGEDDSEEGEIH